MHKDGTEAVVRMKCIDVTSDVRWILEGRQELLKLRNKNCFWLQCVTDHKVMLRLIFYDFPSPLDATTLLSFKVCQEGIMMFFHGSGCNFYVVSSLFVYVSVFFVRCCIMYVTWEVHVTSVILRDSFFINHMKVKIFSKDI